MRLCCVDPLVFYFYFGLLFLCECVFKKKKKKHSLLFYPGAQDEINYNIFPLKFLLFLAILDNSPPLSFSKNAQSLFSVIIGVHMGKKDRKITYSYSNLISKCACFNGVIKMAVFTASDRFFSPGVI